jgi:hypothetical protein
MRVVGFHDLAFVVLRGCWLRRKAEVPMASNSLMTTFDYSLFPCHCLGGLRMQAAQIHGFKRQFMR